MDSGPPAPYDGLASYLRCYRAGFDWPPSEDLIRIMMKGQEIPTGQVEALIPQLMEKFGLTREQVESVIPQLKAGRGLTREQAIRHFTLIYQVRCAIEDYIGREIGEELSIRIFFNRLLEDFGLTVAEAHRLHPGLLSGLLTNFQRWKRAKSIDEEQDVLHHVAEFGKNPSLDQHYDPVSATVFRKALKRFPDPRPVASDSASSGTQPTTSAQDVPEVPAPVASARIDLAELLRKERPKASVQIRFLEMMAGRDWASVEEIAHVAHGDRDTSDAAIRNNVARVNECLEGLKLATRFRVGTGRVTRVEPPA